MSYFDDASLVMIPSGYKTSKVYSVKPTDGTGDLAFSRSNDTATRVGPDGLIEKVRTNLQTYSQNFTSAGGWGGDPVTATANYGTAPDGTQTSTRLVFGSANQVWQKSVSGLNGNLGVFSLYIKGTAGQTISINDGFVDKVITLTSGWTRVSSNGNVASSSNININTYSSVSARDFEVWGGQVELGDIATDYIATTTAAVSVGPVANVPRLDYLNSSCPRLLLEPQRTNLALYSEQFANWSNAGGTTTANTAISPSGYQDADTLTGARFQSSFGSNQYTASCFAKKVDGDNKLVLRLDVPALKFAQFDLATGTIDSVSAGYTATITPYGNGWYRCTITTPVSTSISNYVIVSASGGASNTYIWGAQLEEGAYATSYIPTLGAAVTRGADAASKTSASALIGQTEGTIFWEFQLETPVATGHEDILNIDNGSFGNTIYLYKTPAGAFAAEMYAGGVLQASISSSSQPAGTYKMALGYANNNTALFVNGVQIGITDTSCSVPATSRIQLGNTAIGTSTGKTAQVLLFPTRLTNAQLAELTA